MATIVELGDLPRGKVAARFEGKHHGSAVSFFVGAYPPGFSPPLHRHPYEETFIIEDGGGTFTVDDETIEAHAGQIVVVPAGAAHTFVTTSDVPMRQVSIHPADAMVQKNL